MEFNENAQLDPSQVQPAGPGGRGPGIAIGGGLGGIVVLILSMIFGINPGTILGTEDPGTAPQQQTTDNPYAQCKGTDLNKDRNCRWVAYTNAIQEYWGTQVQGYEVTSVRPFSGTIQTACGTANSQVGPFYCPGDLKVYLDVDFLDDMMNQLGADLGPGAELYILAHEFGHHIQNQTGEMRKAQQIGGTGPGSGQVRLEVQADCYAGVFLRNAPSLPNSPIKSISKDDIMNMQQAAQAVGDDHIQLQSTGGITPESWTHGSSAQRQYWLAVGYNSGDPRACTAFDQDAPNV